MGKLLIVIGSVIALAGVYLVFAEKYDLPRIGSLPGDVVVQKPGMSFYFPWVTMLVVSAVLTIAFWIIGKVWR